MTDVQLRKEGKAGRITLNRPSALNALSHDMCLQIEDALNRWTRDVEVELVILDAAGDRAFCAGGDIVWLHECCGAGRSEEAQAFWRDEYRLNALIDAYPKPFVAVVNGLVMGGGVGISAHASHRVVTERMQFAMPECSIGLVPDVGGSYLLSQIPGFAGEYVGLTGARLDAGDCIYAGLADAFVPSDRISEMKKRLISTGNASVILEFSETPDPSTLADFQGEIDAVFGQKTVADMTRTLSDSRSEFGLATFDALKRCSPASLVAANASIREARKDGKLSAALKNEFRLVSYAASKGDFVEGIRAAVIDKDRNPIWKYKTVDQVPSEVANTIFEPAQGGDLSL